MPPPSKFNRRVPPDLDAICAKALARDVGERYQSGQELAADLNKLLEKYKFDPHELQEFIRGLFRSDFQKEEADLAACRGALPVGERPPAPVEIAIEAPVPGEASQPGPSTQAPTEPSPAAPAAEGDRRGGLWSRIRAKFSKN